MSETNWMDAAACLRVVSGMYQAGESVLQMILCQLE